MSEDRTDDAEADEDGGRGDGKYEINSMGKPVRTKRNEMPCGDAQGAVVKVATMSQHTERSDLTTYWGSIPLC